MANVIEDSMVVFVNVGPESEVVIELGSSGEEGMDIGIGKKGSEDPMQAIAGCSGT